MGVLDSGTSEIMLGDTSTIILCQVYSAAAVVEWCGGWPQYALNIRYNPGGDYSDSTVSRIHKNAKSIEQFLVETVRNTVHIDDIIGGMTTVLLGLFMDCTLVEEVESLTTTYKVMNDVNKPVATVTLFHQMGQ